jgi:DinB superfamily
MGERADAFAVTFEQMTSEVLAVIEDCSDAQWRTPTAAEGWPVGVVAHHIASTLPYLTEWATAASEEHDLGVIPEQINAVNAQHAVDHGACTQAETCTLLLANGAATARTIRAIDDAYLERSATIIAGAPPFAAATVVERVLIGHARRHLANIRAALQMP